MPKEGEEAAKYAWKEECERGAYLLTYNVNKHGCNEYKALTPMSLSKRAVNPDRKLPLFGGNQINSRNSHLPPLNVEIYGEGSKKIHQP